MSEDLAQEVDAPSGATLPSPPPRSPLASVGLAVSGLCILAAGLLGGWVAAGQRGGGGGKGEAQREGKDEEKGRALHLSPRTLANIGVETGEVALSDFVRTRDVPAVVTLRPGALRPVHGTVAGAVVRVLVEVGDVVAAGKPVAEVLRDPFPRPVLSLTDAVLRPLNEDFHRTLADLRSSSQGLVIVREELARIRRVLGAAGGDVPALPGKAEIDLTYEERRSLRALEDARSEALRHGLTAEEIASVESGGALPPDMPAGRRVLERNRLWSDGASAVLAALPEDVRGLPYATAVLGELVGAHALTPELVKVLQSRPALAAAFLEVSGLLQQGLTVPGLLALEENGALSPVVTLRAPADPAPDWDVAAVHVRPGARVEGGTPVVECADLREVRLRLAPAGSDMAAVAAALAAGESVAAEPLVPGSGPSLDGLCFARIEPAEAGAAHGAAVVSARNEPLAVVRGPCDEGLRRSWRLREGLRYMVRVPVERMPGHFVLPADAVIPRGPDSVVLLQDGDGFEPVPVRLVHLDARVAVVANDGAVFPGDRIVLRGAYALSLALAAAAGGAPDPHAGHQH